MKRLKEPRVCLMKVLYYEAWENTKRKDKILHCKDCPCKDDCKDLKELNKEEIQSNFNERLKT